MSSSEEFKDARWQEVQDGHRIWEQAKLCPNDDDKFRTEYVDPLKELEAEGRFEIDVLTHNTGGRKKPFAVKIVSAINYAD